MKREYIWPRDVRRSDNIWIECPRCKKTHKYSSPLENYQTGSIRKCKSCDRPFWFFVEVKLCIKKDLIDYKKEGLIS